MTIADLHVLHEVRRLVDQCIALIRSSRDRLNQARDTVARARLQTTGGDAGACDSVACNKGFESRRHRETSCASAVVRSRVVREHDMHSVLVLDRSRDSAEMYAVGLDLAGFQPQIAPNVTDAMDRLRREPPNALVAEVSDDDTGVWNLIRAAKAQDSTRDIPVIVLTTRTDRSITERIEELDCAALLLKPCLPGTLSAVLRCLLLEPLPSDDRRRLRQRDDRSTTIPQRP